MTEIFGQILALYRFADWEMDVLEGETVASVTYAAEGNSWVFVAAVNEELRTLTLFARAPEPCPAGSAANMVRFFNRVNFGMTHGSWVLDESDGEMRFRVGADLAGRDMAGDELGALTNYVNTVMTATLAAVRAVAAGTVDTEEAMAMVFDDS